MTIPHAVFLSNIGDLIANENRVTSTQAHFRLTLSGHVAVGRYLTLLVNIRHGAFLMALPDHYQAAP